MHEIKNRETIALSLKMAPIPKLIKLQVKPIMLLLEEIFNKHLMESSALEYWKKGGSF